MISIFQQILFSGKVCTISMTKTKDCQPTWIRLPNFLTKPCTQGITSKVVQGLMVILAIIYETTIVAAKSYFPTRSDLSGFLNLINIWWTISNSKQRYIPNVLENATIFGAKKMNCCRIFADWIELWCASPSTSSSSRHYWQLNWRWIRILKNL